VNLRYSLGKSRSNRAPKPPPRQDTEFIIDTCVCNRGKQWPTCLLYVRSHRFSEPVIGPSGRGSDRRLVAFDPLLNIQDANRAEHVVKFVEWHLIGDQDQADDIGLTWRRTARRIKRLKEGVLTIAPDYSDRPTPDLLTLSLKRTRSVCLRENPRRGNIS
jgi:hypothetical protein